MDLAEVAGALGGAGGLADFANGGDDDRSKDADDGDDRKKFDQGECPGLQK